LLQTHLYCRCLIGNSETESRKQSDSSKPKTQTYFSAFFFPLGKGLVTGNMCAHAHVCVCCMCFKHEHNWLQKRPYTEDKDYERECCWTLLCIQDGSENIKQINCSKRNKIQNQLGIKATYRAISARLNSRHSRQQRMGKLIVGNFMVKMGIDNIHMRGGSWLR